jgi:beta-glucanase (GH16 family)
VKRSPVFLVVVAFSIFLTLSPTSASTKNIEGSSCKQSGFQQLQDRDLYSCVKVKSKLVWQLTDDNTSSFAPYPISGPTWQELADIRDAAAKAAAEILTKQAAELRAQQEAAAKAAADAKAAKAAAEIPKVAGLVIGKLLWSDEFLGEQGSTIDSKNWSARNCHRVPTGMGGGACFDSEVVYYAPSAIKLDGSEDGAAVITTTRITGALPSDAGKCLTGYCGFVSGRFDTHNKVSFQYGYIEARIKMPAGSGNHPAFWMLGDNINQVGWPTTGEMDITEIHSNVPNETTAAINYSTYFAPNVCCGNHNYVVDKLNLGADVSQGYHLYALAWLPDSISYYADNKLVYKISRKDFEALPGYWSFDKKFFIILNNAVSEGFSGSSANLQSSTMSIDWVRSYQLNGFGEVTTK